MSDQTQEPLAPDPARPWRRLGLTDRAMAAISAMALVLAIVVVLVLRTVGGPSAETALEGYVAALDSGDLELAAMFTSGDPELVAETLQANVDGLDGATLDAEVVSVAENGNSATATVQMTWEVPEIGEFSYENRGVDLSLAEDEWVIAWSSRVIHPALREDGTRLGTVEDPKDRAPILDRNGAELVSLGAVVDIGLVPGETDDLATTIETLAGLTDIDAETVTESAEAAEPDQVVPVITLREDEFNPIETELRDTPGVTLDGRETPLTPTRDLARATLGTVGLATAEQIEDSEGELDADDVIGQFGLQQAFEDELAGSPNRSIVVRDADGEPVETLQEAKGEGGEALETTLDLDVQLAAEDALAEIEGAAALVAVEPATGNILASATRPTDDTFNRALQGQYPPGSTFKIVSATALLESGLDPDETVDCPETEDVGGREFVNFEGFASGAVPFSTDFAQSCNTAFVSLADRLEPEALRETADLFGIGRGAELPLDYYRGKVPPGEDETEEAAAMIGQARILVSPLAMAGAVAAVQSGAWHAPRLVASDAEEEGEPLPSETLEELRVLMRSVITSGTGTALASVSGEPIGKSGTAEFGDADPPKTHAWFIAAREDIAVAVLVEEGTSGGEVAAPIAAEFLSALPTE